jgi:hypothetical protein
MRWGQMHLNLTHGRLGLQKTVTPQNKPLAEAGLWAASRKRGANNRAKEAAADFVFMESLLGPRGCIQAASVGERILVSPRTLLALDKLFAGVISASQGWQAQKIARDKRDRQKQKNWANTSKPELQIFLLERFHEATAMQPEVVGIADVGMTHFDQILARYAPMGVAQLDREQASHLKGSIRQ